MIGQWIAQVRKSLGIQTVPRLGFRKRVWFGLALCVLIGGMASPAAASQGKTTVRQDAGTAAAVAGAAPHATYRYSSWANGATEIQRSTDGGRTWAHGGVVPEPVLQLAPSPVNDTVVWARTGASLWRSEHSGASWAKVLAPPGRPLALAMTGHSAPSSRIFLGMDTQGLYTSMDGGRTWQAAGGGLSALGAGSFAITALAVSPGAEQVVYAAATFSMATPQGLHTRQLAFISVDDGRHWFEMRLAPRVDQAIAQLTPMAGSLLAVSIPSAVGAQRVGLVVGRDFATGLDDPDPGIRAATARALGFAGERAVLPALISHLADPDLLAGDQVAQAIGRLGDAASVPLLMSVLSDTDEVIRARAATAVGLLHAEEAIPQLSTMLHADGPWASRHAAEALAAIGTPAAMAALMAPLADSQMTAARHTVMRVLETTGQPAVAAVLAALNDPRAVVRANAAEMLGWLKPTHAVADLARLLSDPEPAVQAQAAWALGEIDTPAARLALVPAPWPPANRAPILAPPAVGPIAAASRAVLPVAVADIWTDYWPLAAMVSLFVFGLFAGVLLWKGPRPTAHLGHT